MKERKLTHSQKNKIFRTLLLVFFILVLFITLFPLYCLTLASLKPSQELLRYGLNAKIDLNLFTTKNYSGLFDVGTTDYLFWYKNSLIITILQTFLTLIITSMVGYGIAMFDFPGKNIVFLFVLLVMMIPVESILLPLYQEMVDLSLMDTKLGVILPLIAMPLPIFFFRQYLSGIPKDFQDAGRIDGCGELRVFTRIFVPLLKPAYSAMGIFVAMTSWNNFMYPLVILRTSKNLTLPIGLASLLSPYGNNYDVLIAGSVMAIVPIIIVYMFLQKNFIAGMTAGGVKG